MYRSTIAAALRAGAIVIALMGITGAALAQSAPGTPTFKMAREIVVASGATRAFEGVVPSIMQQAVNVFLQQNPDLQKDLIASAEALRPEFEKRINDIIDIVASVYATRFTEPELKELLEFYNSEVGKKFVAQLPNVLEESFVKTQEWGGRLSGEVVERLRAEMKKKGHTI